MAGKRKKSPGSVEDRRYPYGIESMTSRDDRSLMVWTEAGRDSGKTFRLDWTRGSATAVVREMTDPGTYVFNNWDNSQSGTPATWEEIDSFPVGDALDAIVRMRKYATETLGVVQFADYG